MVQTRRRQTRNRGGSVAAMAMDAAVDEADGGGGPSTGLDGAAKKRKRCTTTAGTVNVTNDDIAKRKTAKGCARRWQALFALRNSRRAMAHASPTSESTSGERDDPFDCSDLIVPPAHELVNREAQRGIDRWKDLAARVVVDEEGQNGDAKAGRDHQLLIDGAAGGDKRRQRLLPRNFDWACETGPHAPGDGAEHHRPKVVSLLDPTQTLEYDEELWRVFKSVKTSEELEGLYALGGGRKDDDGAEGQDDVPHGCRHTFQLKHDLKEWIARYNRMDAHSLGRLRVRKRHPHPAGGGVTSPYCGAAAAKGETGQGPTNTGDGTASPVELHTTIRFEILRHSQNLKRGGGTDGTCMEVELHCERHTLLDLHRLLVECALHSIGGVKGSGNEDEGGVRAGVFFIEDTFYTCGEVGDRVGEAIRRWLDGKEDEETPHDDESAEGPTQTKEDTTTIETAMTPRRQYLGLSSGSNTIPMSEARLEDVPLRLGVRYFHMFVPPDPSLGLRPGNVWSLANESAVYVTGIHTHNGNAATSNDGGAEPAKPPIVIHDAWGSQPRQVCLACNFSLASVVTIDDPLTDGAPPALDAESGRVHLEGVHLEGVPLCSSCYRALHYRPNCDEDGRPSLELRPTNGPGLVFPIDGYQRMVTASSLDVVSKSAAF